MTEFTPVAALLGGALLGLSAALLMLAEGRIAGISGLLAGLFPPQDGRAGHRLAFLAGLVAAPLVWRAFGGAAAQTVSANLPLMLVAGLLVGFGSVHGGGCTSGHGVCGIARVSTRSMIATAVFMATAITTVFVVRHIVGG